MTTRAFRTALIGAGLVAACLFVIAPHASAGGKGKKKASHVLKFSVNPAGFRTQDPSLAITQGEADGVPGPVEVRSSATGTGHWIHLPLDLPAGSNSGKGKSNPLFVMGVEVCHQEGSDSAPPPLSFIDTVRLTKLESPMGSEIEHEDETDFMSETPECLQSPAAFPFPIEGAVTLSLNLDFEKLDDFFGFGAVRILLAGRTDRGISEPSQPSEPSEPSPPSGPSEPSPSVDPEL